MTLLLQQNCLQQESRNTARFEENAYKAQLRLSTGDKTLQEVITVLTRISELGTQARSPAYDGFSRKGHPH